MSTVERKVEGLDDFIMMSKDDWKKMQDKIDELGVRGELKKLNLSIYDSKNTKFEEVIAINFEIGTIYKSRDGYYLLECCVKNKKLVLMKDILSSRSGFYEFNYDGKYQGLNKKESPLDIIREATQEEINEKYMEFGRKKAKEE